MLLENGCVLYVSEELDSVYTPEDLREFIAYEKESRNLNVKDTLNIKESFFRMDFSKLKIENIYTLEKLDLLTLKGCEGESVLIINRFGAFDTMGLDEILKNHTLEYALTESNYLKLSFDIVKNNKDNAKESKVKLTAITLN